jgi:hypothetical protein
LSNLKINNEPIKNIKNFDTDYIFANNNNIDNNNVDNYKTINEKNIINFKDTNLINNPLVFICGDLNACPQKKSEYFGFLCTAYGEIKNHNLNFRSVLNDDLVEEKQKKEIFFTNDGTKVILNLYLFLIK